MCRRILLSGVHGVGKGYFITNKLKSISNLSIISASEIISKYHNCEDAGNKRVKDMERNQRLLLKELKSYFHDHPETVLMDGHLVILNSNDGIQRIPIEFFEKEMFDTVIILQDNPDAIYSRMYARDGVHKLEKELISEIQELERAYAEELKLNGIDICYITPLSAEGHYLRYFREEGTNGVY